MMEFLCWCFSISWLVVRRRPLELVTKIDKIQALAAVHKGYSKKLKFLERTKKCSIGTVVELIDFGGVVCKYRQTDSHRGDGFTKIARYNGSQPLHERMRNCYMKEEFWR